MIVKVMLILLVTVGSAMSDPGDPPQFYPARMFEDPIAHEFRALRQQLATQADWAAIYQVYPNNPAFYRWLERNPRYIHYYLGH